MGGDFDHRWTQAKESLLALKELWTKDEAEFHGNYYDFPPVQMYPKPAQEATSTHTDRRNGPACAAAHSRGRRTDGSRTV